MNIIGFFALIYGWFILENYGFHFEGLVAVVVGLVLMMNKELFKLLTRKRHGKQR